MVLQRYGDRGGYSTAGRVSIYIAHPDGSSVEHHPRQMDDAIWDEVHTIVTGLKDAGVE